MEVHDVHKANQTTIHVLNMHVEGIMAYLFA
jgi:hypothetical protein